MLIVCCWLIFCTKIRVILFSVFETFHGALKFGAKLLVPVMRLQINNIIILTIGTKRGP